MPKAFYCANCGTRLSVALKAIQGNIIRLVEHHECPDEPVEFDLSPIELPEYKPEVGEKNKFVQKINDLPNVQRNIPAPDMKDRRPADQVKQTDAPAGVVEQMGFMQNTTPVGDPTDEPPE